MERGEGVLHLLRKLRVGVPARAEIRRLAPILEMMPDCEKKSEVVALRLTLRELLQDHLFCYHASEGDKRPLEVIERAAMRLIGGRFSHCAVAVVLDLPYALAGDTVFTTDRIQGAAFALALQAETVRKHAARAIWEICK